MYMMGAYEHSHTTLNEMLCFIRHSLTYRHIFLGVGYLTKESVYQHE